MNKLSIGFAASPWMLSAVVATVPAVTVAQNAPSCKALVQIQNNLWFARADGSPIAQITNDSQFRSAAALNPNGSVIAFSGKDAPSDVTLIDATGRLITDVDLQAADAVIDLKWATPTLLSAQEHLSPNAGRFHFVRLGAGSTASVLAGSANEGTSCAMSPDGKNTACVVGDATVELNGREIYRSIDSVASATTVQTVDVAVGTGMTTSTSPPFRVDVKGISDGSTVQLRVTTPDGLWTEQHVPPGNALDVQFADPPEGTPRYAVLPTITSSSGVVRLAIKRSNTGDYSFEGGVAWDPRGKRIAVVESNALGQRTWILLNSEMGQAATKAAGAIDAKQPLPIDGPVGSISFTSDTHLRIVGATQVFDKDIPAQGKVPAGGPYAITQALPQVLTVKINGVSMTTDVKGWACP
jgi:hypothetical protein